MFKVFYAGDNRDRANWGCRATSMALGEIIGSVAEVSGVLHGKEALSFSMSATKWSGPNPSSNTILPARALHKAIRGLGKLKHLLIKENQQDYISDDADRSIQLFHRILPFNDHLRQIWTDLKSCDAIVLNGEGTYIFSDPPRRDTLFYNFLIRQSVQIQKPVVLANAMFSDCPRSKKNRLVVNATKDVLQQCNAITCRDPTSLQILRNIGASSHAKYIPDALFTWHHRIKRWTSAVSGDLSFFEPFGSESYNNALKFNLAAPYVCVSGSSSAAWNQKDATNAYTSLISALSKLGIQLLIIPTCGGDRFLIDVAKELKIALLPLHTPIRVGAAILGNAQALVSGRFHPSILASCGGTPCVFLGSNSHKTRSLQEMLQYPRPREFSALPNDAEITDIVAWTRDAITRGDKLRGEVSSVVARLSEEAYGVADIIRKIHASTVA